MVIKSNTSKKEESNQNGLNSLNNNIEKIKELGFQIKPHTTLDKTFYSIIKDNSLINVLSPNDLNKFIEFQLLDAENILNNCEGLSIEEKTDLNIKKVVGK